MRMDLDRRSERLWSSAFAIYIFSSSPAKYSSYKPAPFLFRKDEGGPLVVVIDSCVRNPFVSVETVIDIWPHLRV